MGQTLSANTFLLNEGYEKLNNHDDGTYLKIHPQELQFPFELKKQISCSLRLSNNSNKYLAFKIKTTNPKKYYVKPNIIEVVLPRSTCDIIVTMLSQNEAPIDMQCKDRFLIQSIVLSKKGATIKDVKPNMFNKASGYEVQDYRLKVVYVAPPQPPSSVREASNKDTSLKIHPPELQFPFELKKQISCSLQLSNNSDNNVAFKVKTTNPKKYCVKPNNGVVLPRSTFDIIVKMQAQKEAPPDMQCNDKFLIQSIVANHKIYQSKNGATTKDITLEMFNKESGYKVDESKLRVVYVAPPQPLSLVHEGSDEDLSPRASGFSNQARALISKLTEERNSAIEKYKRLEQELELLRREANNDCHT